MKWEEEIILKDYTEADTNSYILFAISEKRSANKSTELMCSSERNGERRHYNSAASHVVCMTRTRVPSEGCGTEVRARLSSPKFPSAGVAIVAFDLQ